MPLVMRPLSGQVIIHLALLLSTGKVSFTLFIFCTAAVWCSSDMASPGGTVWCIFVTGKPRRALVVVHGIVARCWLGVGGVAYLLRSCRNLTGLCLYMSRKGPVAVLGMLDFVEDLIKDVYYPLIYSFVSLYIQ